MLMICYKSLMYCISFYVYPFCQQELKKIVNPFQTNGHFHYAKYNKVSMIHCIYLGVTGYNFQLVLYFFT